MAKSSLAIPMGRGDFAIGAPSLGRRERGGFSDSQAEPLKTFAEQGVIAIGSAETYRALQTRTADPQESPEYPNRDQRRAEGDQSRGLQSRFRP
jgi:hypothetical protein